MDIKVIIILVAFANFFLASLLFLHNRHRKAHLSFSIFSFSIGIWCLTLYFYEHPILFSNTTWIKLVYTTVLFPILPSCFHFSLTFPKYPYNKKLVTIPMAICWASVSILLAILWFTDLWVKEVILKESQLQTSLGSAYLAFGLVSSVFGLWLFLNLIRKYSSAKGITKMQLRYIFVGLFSYIVPTITVDIAIPLITGYSGLFWISPIFSLSFVLATFYAITRYRLIDVRLILKRGGVSFLSLVTVVGLTIGSIWLISLSMNYHPNPTLMVGGAITMAISVLLFFPIRSFLQKLADKFFFPYITSSQQTLRIVSQKLLTIIDLEELVKLVMETAQNTMGLDKVAVILRSKENSHYQIYNIGFNRKDCPSLLQDSFLTNYLKTSKKPLVYEEIKLIIRNIKDEHTSKNLRNLKDIMKRLGVNLCLPLISKERLEGIIILGRKLSGEAYTQEDLELLETLANQTSLAIQNAIQYEKIQDLTENLQEKVDEQVKEINKKNIHLQKLLKMKGEFLDIASHQLRTPVSVILGTISMFKDKSVLEMPEETREKFVDNIYRKALKLRSIIEDILSASEMDATDFEKTLNFAPVQLEDLLEEIYQDNLSDAKNSDLTLTYQKPEKKLPLVNIDPRYIREALDNLVDNAIRYTPKGGKISLSIQKIDDKVVINIKDTGIGIPKDEIKNLFQKFYRASNATQMHTDGSGLGLFIVKKVIDAHPLAQISLTSEEGKGTSFTLSFPIIK